VDTILGQTKKESKTGKMGRREYNLSYCFREVIDLLMDNRVLIKSLATNPSIHYEHRNKIYGMNN